MEYRSLVVAGLLAAMPSMAAIELTSATVVSAPADAKAAQMLVEEVAARSGVRWRRSAARPASGAAIVLERGGGGAAEGFRNSASGGGVVTVAGSDRRGVLYGVGHLLRNLEMRRGRVTLREGYGIATAPESKIRGHQLGYRPKTNSYDGWTIPMWEQYVRDLAVFGANAVELIPPRSDDADDSPHFPQSKIETMIAMSRILDEYGMDVWVWHPALDADYRDAKTVAFALKEWGEVYAKLKRVDAVLVPAGDPGHTPAAVLLPFLEKQAANLKKFHPKAGLWLAPQGFDAESIEIFFRAMEKRPAWLAGIVYGPQTRISLPELRKRLPAQIPIRHYPDITHSRQSQYPMPDWDVAWAVTSSREPINPRPLDQASIFRAQQKHTIGFITYSEGCNDDVNKAVWSGLGWNRETPPVEILREYSRYFIGPDFADDFAQGLMALERNWRGPALGNGGVRLALARFQEMERRASPQMLANWRFQQGLYRAYYDAYVQSRLARETALEEQAMEELRRAGPAGAAAAMDAAERTLDKSSEPVALELRTRVFQLAEALFQSIRMQLSVALYQGMSGRGNTLDTVDFPLNSRGWLKEEMARIRRLGSESERLKEIARLVNWTDPGPGGFYDDLGNASMQPHLVPGQGFAEDPQFFRTPVMFYDTRGKGRRSWWDQALALYEHPLELKYDKLEGGARYRLRVVYGAGPLRLEAGGREVHGYLEKPFEPLEFDIPEEATRSGSLTLRWNRTPGAGGAGRGCQVAEAWLMRR